MVLYLRCAGREQPGSSRQELATQSADMTADYSTAGEPGMDTGFEAFDDFDDGAAGIATLCCTL